MTRLLARSNLERVKARTLEIANFIFTLSKLTQNFETWSDLIRKTVAKDPDGPDAERNGIWDRAKLALYTHLASTRKSAVDRANEVLRVEQEKRNRENRAGR